MTDEISHYKARQNGNYKIHESRIFLFKEGAIMIETLLSIIYPPKCCFCENIIPITQELWVCKICKEYLVYLTKDESLTVKQDSIHNLRKNIALFSYDEMISNGIKNGKYNNHPNYFIGFGNLMGKSYLNYIDFPVDYIFPIPIHEKRERQRGFNQAELMATEISKVTNIPLIKDGVIRVKNTKAQSEIKSSEGRFNNLLNAFKFNRKYNINAKNILLIDDIYTTGNTMFACASLLKENGAENVYGYTLSIVTKKNDDGQN